MAIEIYKYTFDTDEWENIRNSKLEGQERENAFNEYIKQSGTKVTIKEYFQDFRRKDDYYTKTSYKCFGKPTNAIEQIVFAETDYLDNLSYLSANDNHPEDLIESRTDWESMKDYADGMYYFIQDLIDDIAEGKIIVNDKINNT